MDGIHDARFHGVGREAVVDQIKFSDVTGTRKRGFDGVCITEFPVEALIAWNAVVQLR